MTVWEIIRQIREHPPASPFFDELPKDNIVFKNGSEYTADETFEIDPESHQFPQTIWPKDLKIAEFPPINQDQIDERVEESGTEALAWYRSFHWKEPEYWGIYIPVRSIWYLAEKFYQGMGSTGPLLEYVQSAYSLILNHELFHYIVDMGSTVLESSVNFETNFYTRYIRKKNPDNEEAIANAWALRKSYKPSNIKRTIRSWMDSQPPGYRDFSRFTGKKLTGGLRSLGHVISENDRDKIIPIDGMFNLHENFKMSKIPVYFLATKDIPIGSPYFLSLAPSYERESIEHSNRFKKQLDKQSRGNPRLKRDLENAIMQLGDPFSKRSLNWKPIKRDVYQFRINQKCRVHCSPAGTRLILDNLMCHH